MTRKQCSEPNCKSGARDKTSMKCKIHNGGSRCSEPNCPSSAQDKTSMKCIRHGGGIRCSESGCPSKARDKTSMKCVLHNGGIRCSEPNCPSSAQDKTSMKCIRHGGGSRCSEIDCKASAQHSTDKCIAHGGGRRCSETGCKSSAQDKTSMKCVAHGGRKRCPNCINWIDSRCGNVFYDGYCATCFKRVFPEDKRSKRIYSHTKEIRVRNEINKYFEGFIHDIPLYTGNCDCTHRRRVDHRRLIGNTLLAIETDEYAHRSYDEKYEEIRYDS